MTKEFFRTCNVLPFSCTHLALWRGIGRRAETVAYHLREKEIGFQLRGFFILTQRYVRAY
jgi:hypothetical protein